MEIGSYKHKHSWTDIKLLYRNCIPKIIIPYAKNKFLKIAFLRMETIKGVVFKIAFLPLEKVNGIYDTKGYKDFVILKYKNK